MGITKKILSLPALITLVFITFLKLLPFIAVFYLLPAFLILAAAVPYGGRLEPLMRLGFTTDIDVLLSALRVVWHCKPALIVGGSFLGLYIFATIYTYIMTEYFLNKNHRTVVSSFFETFASLPNYLGAWIFFLGTLACFVVAPLVPMYFMNLPYFVRFILWIIWGAGVVAAVIFLPTSLFFTRIAVLRKKQTHNLFTESWRVMKKRLINFLAFFGIIFLITAAALGFTGLLFAAVQGIFSSFAGDGGPVVSRLLFMVIQGFIILFYASAVTVYYLNIDYNINPGERHDLYSRVAGIRDSSIPELK